MKLILSQNNKDIGEIVVSDEDIIGGNSLFVGRESDCHIILDDIQVSRHHAKIMVEENNLLIENISTNGIVKIDGLEVNKSQIEQDSIIQIGKFALRVAEHSALFEKLILEKMSMQEVPVENIQNEVSETEIVNEPVENIQDKQVEESKENPIAIQDELTFASEIETSAESGPAEAQTVEEAEVKMDGDLDMSLDLGGEGLNLEISDESPNLEMDNNEGENIFTEEPDQNDNAFNFESEVDTPAEESDNNFESFGNEDDEFEDKSFGTNNLESSGDSTEVFTGFAKFTLKLFGEYAPVDSFNIIDEKTYIGRDPEKCQIILDDPEVSTIHAIISKTALNCTLEDNDSSNGTIINGERINSKSLVAGDEFLIGTTSFTVTVQSDLIDAEKDILMPVEPDQEIEVEEIVEEEMTKVNFDISSDVELTTKDKIEKFIKEKKKTLIIFVVLLLAILLLDDDKKTKPRKVKAKTEKSKEIKKKKVSKKKFSPAVMERLEQNYVLATSKFDTGEYYEAKEYLDQVMSVDPDYKDAQTLSKLINEGYDKLIQLKNEEEAEKERKKRQLKISAILKRAEKAVKERKIELANSFFEQILEIDPENIDVPPLKLEIEAYKKEQEKINFEKNRKASARKAMVDALKPGKSAFLKNDWYAAVINLEKFLEIKKMDEDLIKEATKMLKTANSNLLRIVNPLRSKARSYLEGQDLKLAYETYGEVLKYDPSDEEAIDEREKIVSSLRIKSKKLYREGLVAESLSSFSKAKERFQEVMQVSPDGSEYYIKAKAKLDNYLE